MGSGIYGGNTGGGTDHITFSIATTISQRTPIPLYKILSTTGVSLKIIPVEISARNSSGHLSPQALR
jgi:hypothetical protein